MFETVPAAPPAPAEKTPGKKKARKPAGATKRKASASPVSELITKAVSASKERSGVSLAAMKKALPAAGYDVKNSHIKLGLQSLVNKGTLVQTKGTGASGSFILNKKATTRHAKPKAKKVGTANPKKAAGAVKSKARGATTPEKSVKTTPKKVKKTVATIRAKVAKSPKEFKTTKPKEVSKAKAPKPKESSSKSVMKPRLD
ncbi:histone H1.4 isoform X2 [Camelus dromedarius]|uniref:histone H1.4 isoform X2 n=1 Tax=Camelus dromedarius TaxID=9838 RepID=UPI00311A9175